jgi:hypothetical protein
MFQSLMVIVPFTYLNSTSRCYSHVRSNDLDCNLSALMLSHN